MRMTITCTQCDKGTVVDVAADGSVKPVRGSKVSVHTGWIQGAQKYRAYSVRCGKCRSAIINVWPADNWETPNGSNGT